MKKGKDVIEVMVRWDSDQECPSEIVEYLGLSYRIVPVESDENASIHVFDADRWDGPEESGEGFHHERMPSLVLCSEKAEAQWLRITPELSEVCGSENPAVLAFRLVRMSIRNEERSQMAQRAFTDSLTGALPRLELLRRLGMEVFAARPDRPVAVLLIDLDHFKEVNDRYGRQAGDKVLAKVGSILRDATGGRPDLYRYRGEEFVVVASMDRTQATAFAEFVRTQIEECVVESGGYEITVTTSVGVAISGGEADREALIESADRALYEAKSRGRNRVVEVSEYFEEVQAEGGDPVIRDFENRIRVLTERLTDALTYRSKQLVSRYKREAEIDGLSGLYVRRYFDRLLAREFETSRDKQRPLSMIFIDLDHFGDVNKTYGFPTGDHALEMVAGTIREHIRAVDWAARYDGEEMVVVLPDTDEDQACDIAKRIWTEVGKARLKAFDGREFNLTLSAGVAQLRDTDTDPEAFVQRTSDRTRRAKNQGRNRVWCTEL